MLKELPVKKSFQVYQATNTASSFAMSFMYDEAHGNREVQHVMDGQSVLRAPAKPRVATLQKATTKPVETASALRLKF